MLSRRLEKASRSGIVVGQVGCMDRLWLTLDSVDISQRPRPDRSSVCSIVLARTCLCSSTGLKVNKYKYSSVVNARIRVKSVECEGPPFGLIIHLIFEWSGSISPPPWKCQFPSSPVTGWKSGIHEKIQFIQWNVCLWWSNKRVTDICTAKD